MSNAAAAPAAAQAAAPATGKSKKGKLIAIIVIAGVVLGGGGAGAFFMLGGKQDHEDKPHGKEEAKTPSTADQPKRGKIVTLNPIVVNLRGSSGTRYLKVAIALESPSNEAVEELKEITAPLTDMLRERLASAKLEELDQSEGRNRLKRDLLQGVNDLLTQGFISNLYFSEFVIQ